MAEKSDLAPGAVQNVLVYVSNDNFAQAYTVEQNVPPNSAPNGAHPMVAPRNYEDKTVNINVLKQDYAPNNQFFAPAPQNGFNLEYQVQDNNGGLFQPPERQGGTRFDSNYPIVGPPAPESAQCDSVRSETASSCSSLSSTDENTVLVQNGAPEMVVYDSSVSVRPAPNGVVLQPPVGAPQQAPPVLEAVAGPSGVPQQHFPYIVVPYRWKRLVSNGAIIYVSPSNTVLSGPEQVKEYLLSSGTCKCGLECHFKYDNVFNFDPKVASKPWTLSPDTNVGDLTKLCNHKRKIIAMASLDLKPPDPNQKIAKEFTVKKKKRRIGIPYSGNVSRIMAHREKMEQQHFSNELVGSQQAWPQQQNIPQITSNRLQGVGFPPQENIPQNQQMRYPNQESMPILTGSQNISQKIHDPNSKNIQIRKQQIMQPDGQIVEIHHHNPPTGGQKPVNFPGQNNAPHLPQNNNMFANQQQQQPQRFLNNDRGLIEGENGPGRPDQFIPDNRQAELQHRLQQNYLQQQQYSQQMNRPFLQPMNGFRPNISNNQIPTMLDQQRMAWQNRPPPQNNLPNIYDRVPPLHQHLPQPLIWQGQEDTSKRKKVKGSKMAKNNRHFNGMEPRMDPITHGQNNMPSGPCPNIDVRQIPCETGGNRPILISQMAQNQNTSPSFLEDPSGYLAQQTALLNSTINRQTGANSHPANLYNMPPQQYSNQNNMHPNINNKEMPIPSNVSQQHKENIYLRNNQNMPMQTEPQNQQGNAADSQGMPDSSAPSCQGCACAENANMIHYHNKEQQNVMQHNLLNSSDSSMNSEDPVTSSNWVDKHQNSPDSRPIQGGTVSTSNFSPANDGVNSGPPTPNPYNSHPHTPNPTINTPGNPPGVNNNPLPSNDLQNCNQQQTNQQNITKIDNANIPFVVFSTNNAFQQGQKQIFANTAHFKSLEAQGQVQGQPQGHFQRPPTFSQFCTAAGRPSYLSGVVTAMASGRTVGSNTITSVLAGKANTATVSINAPAQQSGLVGNVPGGQHPQEVREVLGPNSIITNQQPQNNINISKSPLEMVQSVVSSIQVPPQNTQRPNNNQITLKQPSNLQQQPQQQQQHILVSSNGQLIMASTANVMAPPPPKIVTNQLQNQLHNHMQNHGLSAQSLNQGINQGLTNQGLSNHGLTSHGLTNQGISNHGLSNQGLSTHGLPNQGLSNIGQSVANHGSSGNIPSISGAVTNVTAAVTQMIPAAVAQQVLGQQTVLVNALPAPFVLQPGMTMTMDANGMQNVQLPQLVAGNVIQQQITTSPNQLISPDIPRRGTSKPTKKKKLTPQSLANMLIQQSNHNNTSGLASILPQHYQQPIHMTTAHSGGHGGNNQVMQTLTIMPGKNGGATQIVMNGQPGQIISQQPAQQINLLQPVNLLNGTTGVVQNFPTIQQFIVPNLGGMVMNPDGTATILQDTSNLGMQLQLQNVNGQNVLTPVQSFNGGQSILATGPAGMVIRTATPAQNKLLQQQHSPGAAQFLSPNGGGFVVNNGQFSGQLSPLVANVSPNAQVTFSAPTQQVQQQLQRHPQQQEYIQCNQMGQTLMVPCTPVSSNNPQNTTFVQQNTTIVQQQTTMVQQQQQQQQQHENIKTVMNDKQPQIQAVLLQQQQQQHIPNGNLHHQHSSVSTQTATQNSHAITTNTSFCQTSTICAGSPPDTTTHSPLNAGGQSPPTGADTTTHTGSTDDGLSPAPSNCSNSFMADSGGGGHQSSMAMVHCISSSEPDSADLNTQLPEYDQSQTRNQQHPYKTEFMDTQTQMHFNSKKTVHPNQIAFAESSTVSASTLGFMTEHNLNMKSHSQDNITTNYERMVQKHAMMHQQMHYNGNEDSMDPKSQQEVCPNSKTFRVSDLVWGPYKNMSSWPGKIIELNDDTVSVKWFGNDKHISIFKTALLQTLSEGLDAHHRDRKKSRTSRKLNTQLEKAIQEAMAELDKDIETSKKRKITSHTQTKFATSEKIKSSGRLRSSKK